MGLVTKVSHLYNGFLMYWYQEPWDEKLQDQGGAKEMSPVFGQSSERGQPGQPTLRALRIQKPPGLRDFDDGTRFRIYNHYLEDTCCVPGCHSWADRRFKATKNSYYCEPHARGRAKIMEHRLVIKVEDW